MVQICYLQLSRCEARKSTDQVSFMTLRLFGLMISDGFVDDLIAFLRVKLNGNFFLSPSASINLNFIYAIIDSCAINHLLC